MAMSTNGLRSCAVHNCGQSARSPAHVSTVPALLGRVCRVGGRRNIRAKPTGPRPSARFWPWQSLLGPALPEEIDETVGARCMVDDAGLSHSRR